MRRFRRHLRGRGGLVFLLVAILLPLVAMFPPHMLALLVVSLGAYTAGRLHERLRASRARRPGQPGPRRTTP